MFKEPKQTDSLDGACVNFQPTGCKTAKVEVTSLKNRLFVKYLKFEDPFKNMVLNFNEAESIFMNFDLLWGRYKKQSTNIAHRRVRS